MDDAPPNVHKVKEALSLLADNAAADIADDVRRHVVVRVADEVVVELPWL